MNTNRRRFRHILASTVAVPLLLSAGIAQAADAAEDEAAAADAAPAEEGEAIVVTGSIVSSQEASLDAKRAAPNLADIAAADAVGRFPDQNSAAALSRLPAVAVQRDQGQERYIQVRGAPNRWTSVSIDGVPMSGVDEGGDSRAFRFDAVPAVLLSQMVVNKSLTAGQQADAIVATIDLKTWSPLASEGLSIAGDVGLGRMDQGEGEQRQGSIRASWSNGSVGVVLGGSHYRRFQTTDNREVGLYDAPSSGTDTTFGPTEIDIRQYQLERWSNGLFGGVELAATPDLRVFVKGIFTEFNDDEQRNQYELRLDRATAGFRNHTSADLTAVPFRGSFNYGEYRNKNYIGTAGADFSDGMGWEAALRLNYTRSDNNTYLPLVQASTSGLNSPSLTYDRTDPRFPVVTLYQTLAGATAGTYVRGTNVIAAPQALFAAAGAIEIDARQQTVADSYTAKLDVRREFDNGLSIDAGAYLSDRQIEGNNFSFVNVATVGASGGTVGQPFNVNSYVTDKPWQTQFPLGFTLNYIDNVSMRADVDSLLIKMTAAGLFDPAKSVPSTDRYQQDEALKAAFVSGTMDMGALTVIAGLRLENYSMDNAGTVVIGGIATPLAVKQDYTDLFPSLNLRLETSDDLIVRLSGQRGIARPAYGQIRVGASINDTASPGTIGGGNPGLLPEYTWGTDASIEYYLPGNGILSIAAFHRWVDNVFYQNQQAVGSDVFNTGGRDRSAYLLTSTFNGENGRLYGVEFNAQKQFDFLPSPLDGFGFQGNLALLGGKFDTQTVNGVQTTDIPFQGMSDTIANASLFYEKAGFSARVSYQWRSDWLDTLGGLGSGESRKGYENVDVSLRYAVSENFTLFADLSNLTDERYVAYEGDASRPTEVEQIGERYMFGLRFNF